MTADMSALNDDFEKGRCWAQYTSMQAKFLDFMRYVPYTRENSGVCSPMLAILLVETCSYIDRAIKIMREFGAFRESEDFQKRVEEAKLRKKEVNPAWWMTKLSAEDWLEIFEKPYNISTNDEAALAAKLRWHGNKGIRPFGYLRNSKGRRAPDWWDAYNPGRCRWIPPTFRKATLEHVLQALAGAFLLNALHYPSIRFLWNEGILEIGRFCSGMGWIGANRSDEEFGRIYNDSIRNMQSFNETYRIETELFIFTHLKQTKEKSQSEEEASKSLTDAWE